MKECNGCMHKQSVVCEGCVDYSRYNIPWLKIDSPEEFRKKCLTITALDDAQFQKALERYRELCRQDLDHPRLNLILAFNSVGCVVQEGY